MYRRACLLVLLSAPLLGACETEEPAEEAVVVQTPPAAPAAGEQQAVSYPDTTAEAVWSHLQEQSYRHWPGKEPYYEGVEPHGLRLRTYLNQVAYDGLTGEAKTLPDRSIIVKENYTPDSTLVATTVMYKAPGFDPENNDWWWLKRTAEGEVEGAGRVEGCINCHSAEAKNDYVMTATLASGGMEPTAAARAAKQGGGGGQ